MTNSPTFCTERTGCAFPSCNCYGSYMKPYCKPGESESTIMLGCVLLGTMLGIVSIGMYLVWTLF